MIKQTLIAVATLALSAVPALATTNNTGSMNGNSLIVNDAQVSNHTTTSASSGWNFTTVYGGTSFGNSNNTVMTGNAQALSQVDNMVNTTSLTNCGCTADTNNTGWGNGNSLMINKAHVYNSTNTSAFTGGNVTKTMGDSSFSSMSNSVTSGAASAGSWTTNVVNTVMQ